MHIYVHIYSCLRHITQYLLTIDRKSIFETILFALYLDIYSVPQCFMHIEYVIKSIWQTYRS